MGNFNNTSAHRITAFLFLCIQKQSKKEEKHEFGKYRMGR